MDSFSISALKKPGFYERRLLEGWEKKYEVGVQCYPSDEFLA